MEELNSEVKLFIMWLSDPKTPFETVFNGHDQSRPRIYYHKGTSDKTWLLEEVFDFWLKNVLIEK